MFRYLIYTLGTNSLFLYIRGKKGNGYYRTMVICEVSVLLAFQVLCLMCYVRRLRTRASSRKWQYLGVSAQALSET